MNWEGEIIEVFELDIPLWGFFSVDTKNKRFYGTNTFEEPIIVQYSYE